MHPPCLRCRAFILSRRGGLTNMICCVEMAVVAFEGAAYVPLSLGSFIFMGFMFAGALHVETGDQCAPVLYGLRVICFLLNLSTAH